MTIRKPENVNFIFNREEVLPCKLKHILNHVRIAPRKAKLVVDLIRGKAVGEAIAILRHTPKAASPILEKLLNSAIANAEHNYSLDPNKLVVI